jgi:hypothetical protein
MSKKKEKKKAVSIEQKPEEKPNTGLKWISSGDLRLVPLELFERNKEIRPEIFFEIAKIAMELPRKLNCAIYGLDRQTRKIKAVLLCSFDILNNNLYIRDLFGYLRDADNFDDDLIRELAEIKKSYQAKKVKLLMDADIEELNKGE